MGEGCSPGERMDECRTKIPEEIIQEIFCRIPFPEILKVREISKCWNAFFQNDLKSKLPALKPSQAEVVPIFTWARYCPVPLQLYENQLDYDSDM
ncbi:hypothetical protein R1flu_023062 [Riccia fluitans]|uniref:F-box domain-containing protein n=1 Tax=Riccia fluitans TaxID=41844 RepID=A0ABD1XR07_9MARC